MLNDLRVLIAEDEGLIALDIKNILRTFGFKDLTLVRNGTDAVKKVDELKPDIVILDIMMEHGIDGIEAAEIILNNYPHKPLIFITASTDHKTFEAARSLNPLAILHKPFSEQELFLTIITAVTHLKKQD